MTTGETAGAKNYVCPSRRSKLQDTTSPTERGEGKEASSLENSPPPASRFRSYLGALARPAEDVAKEKKQLEKTGRKKVVVVDVPTTRVTQFDKRVYDLDGWMLNDDWIIWFEHSHRSEIPINPY